MKKTFLILSIFILNIKIVDAQIVNVREHFAIGYATKKNMSATTFGYNGTFVFGEKQIIHTGFGLRMTLFNEQSGAFNGVGKTNSAVSLIPASKANLNSLNLPIYLEFHSKYVLIGANVDLLGFSFGKKKDVFSVIGVKQPDSLSIRPTTINFFGRGTNNAELYLGFKPRNEITIRMGICFLSPEYHAQFKQLGKYYDFGRFSHQAIMPFITIVLNNDR